MDPLLFIVSRDRSELHDYLTKEFRRDEHIQVLLDRRTGDRRQRTAAHDPDQRQDTRRHAFTVDEEIRTVGFAVVRSQPASAS